MSCYGKPLLPVSTAPNAVVRDGYVYPEQSLYVAFLPYLWRVDGAVVTYPATTAPQYEGQSMSGTFKPNTYSKPGCCGPALIG